MIAFDTNLVIRFLVADDAVQTAASRRLLDRCVETEEDCYLSDGVLCEIEWVLTSSYRAGRSEVLAAFSALLANDRFVFDDRLAVRDALASYESGRGDLSDHLIGARARRKGARTTYTFDRALGGHPGFTLLR